MADFDKPDNLSDYANVWDYVKAVQESLALWQDGTTDTNIPTGAKRYSSTNKRFETYNGTSWVPLIALDADQANAYQIRVAKANSVDLADLATNALRLGSVLASEYVQTTDTRLLDTTPRPCNNTFVHAPTARAALSVYSSLETDARYGRFATGDKIYAYQATAPVGWTIVSGLGDKILAVGTYDGKTPGNTGGTWTQPGHVLTEAEMPSHVHSLSQAPSSVYTYVSGYSEWGFMDNQGGVALSTVSGTIGYSGGNNGHSHGALWRPAAVVGIIIQKS